MLSLAGHGDVCDFESLRDGLDQIDDSGSMEGVLGLDADWLSTELPAM